MSILKKNIINVFAVSLLSVLVACNKEVKQANEAGNVAASNGLAGKNSATGFVYTMSNNASVNTIETYAQAADGTLTYVSSTPSGGQGSGKGLGSQYSLVVDKQHKWLYAVNAGSNSVSSFSIDNGTPTLAHTTATNGVMPVSVSVYNNLLFVVNGGTSNINGFSISNNGAITHIDGSDHNLSTANAGPAEISFTPTGDAVVVTEKNNNKITTFAVKGNGNVSDGNSKSSAGTTPFGFDFSGSNIIVTEASGGMAGASTVSSYSVRGTASLVTGPLATQQTSACWATVSADGRLAYITNTMSNTISSFSVSNKGNLELLNATAIATGTTPTDITFSGNNNYIYNINSASHTITEFKKADDATLTKIGEVTIPVGALGIAAF